MQIYLLTLLDLHHIDSFSIATDGYRWFLGLDSLSIRSSGVWGAHLSLQLADRRRQVDHQLGDVLQLVLQNLDGFRLLLVLKSTT